MRKPLFLFVFIIPISWISTGCDSITKEDQSAIVGGVIGAAVGSRVGKGRGRTAATIVGAIAGTMIGRKIGRQYDQHDHQRTATILENNRDGQATSWRNPNSGYAYTTAPTRTYYEGSGEPCREFTMDANIGGRPEKVYGTACRQADGSWKIIK